METAFVARATDQLLRLTGRPDASFRPGQLEAIHTVHTRRAKSLVVQRTGWGKSAVYFIATALNRADGNGPTLLVSPLLALMRNQIQAAEALGLRAVTVNSTNPDAWASVFAAIDAGDVDLVLVSPERLNNPAFRTQVLGDLVASAGLLVVDEAHCISDWGHDFRPDYRRLGQVMGQLLPNTPVLLTTATANQRVIDDIVAQLGDDLQVVRGPLDRESLRLDAFTLGTHAERMAWVSQHLDVFPGSGIIYCSTIRDAESLAGFLRDEGHDAAAYSGQTDDTTRQRIEADLAANRVKAVVATSALGMGYDKPDLRWVIHYQRPGSTVAYYQQVGRAGRAVDQAWGVLLSGDGDEAIQEHFITTAFPSEDDARRIIDALGDGDGLGRNELLKAVNLQPTRLESFLKQLEVDGFVERHDRRWRRRSATFTYPHERIAGITDLRRRELRRMIEYVATEQCLMDFLRTDLDDPASGPCGRCTRCTGQHLDRQPDPEVLARAEAWLHGRHPTIEPRRQWVGGRPEHLPSLPGAANEAGFALVRGDSDQWRRHRHPTNGTFDAAIVAQLAELAAARIDPGSVGFVTHIPSRRSGAVADLAERLAKRLKLPHVDLLAVADGPAQHTMANSATQLANAARRISLAGSPPPVGGIIIDDTVDSRWTLTVAGALLRGAGATAVYPFVVADTSVV